MIIKKSVWTQIIALTSVPLIFVYGPFNVAISIKYLVTSLYELYESGRKHL